MNEKMERIKNSYNGIVVFIIIFVCFILVNVKIVKANINDSVLISKRAEVEDESVKKYMKLIDRFKNSDNNTDYPDYYGGAFLNNNGKLVLQITDESSSMSGEMYSYYKK